MSSAKLCSFLFAQADQENDGWSGQDLMVFLALKHATFCRMLRMLPAGDIRSGPTQILPLSSKKCNGILPRIDQRNKAAANFDLVTPPHCRTLPQP